MIFYSVHLSMILKSLQLHPGATSLRVLHAEGNLLPPHIVYPAAVSLLSWLMHKPLHLSSLSFSNPLLTLQTVLVSALIRCSG